MMKRGPLDHPELRAVEKLLDDRHLEEAQRRLGALGQAQGLDHGVTYLATRLLFQRGRLDTTGVAERLRELLRDVGHFPEAKYMLDAAEAGVLARTAPPKAVALPPEPEEPTPPSDPHPASTPSAASPAGYGQVALPDASAVIPKKLPDAPHATLQGLSDAPPPAENAPPLPSDAPTATADEPEEAPAISQAWPTPAAPAVEGAVPEAVEPAPLPKEAPRIRAALPLTAESLELGAPWEQVSQGDEPLEQFPGAEVRTQPLASMEEVLAIPQDPSSRTRPLASLEEAFAEAERTTGTGAPVTTPPPKPGSRPPSPLRSSEPPPTLPPASESTLDALREVRRDWSMAEAQAFEGQLTDEPVRVQEKNHISTEPGVGTPSDKSAPDGSLPSDLTRLMSPSIPRAPGLPRITPPPDQTPSYVPAQRQGADLRPVASSHQPVSSVEAQGISDLAPPGHPSLEDKPEPPGTRYSASPGRADFVFSQPARNRTNAQPRKVERFLRDSSAEDRRAAAHESDAPVSLASMRNRVERGDYESVLRATTSAGAPPWLILRARALQGMNRSEQALGVLRSVCSDRDLGAEARAEASQAMVELHVPDQALEQARTAWQAAPDLAAPRLAVAWAALRLLRRNSNDTLAVEAESVLANLRGRGGPRPGLVLSLRACVQAHVGDAERAIGLAQRALGMNPRSSDALAAITLASIRLRRVRDAQQAWLRLQEEDPEEAAVLRPRLEGSGIEIPTSGPTREGFADDGDVHGVWNVLEINLLEGAADVVQHEFERMCRERLAQLTARGEDEGFPALSAVAVTLLTKHPIWSHFAPFDRSLWSIARVQAALDLVYDPTYSLRTETDGFPVVLLLGAYLGQVLCQTHDGHWEGRVTDLDRVVVAARDRAWSPFQIVDARLRLGTPINFDLADDLWQAHPGADQWAEHVTPSVTPPNPWGDAIWPPVTIMPRLGRAMSRSVVSTWCRREAAGPLDGSMASLGSLDAYLLLLAPPAARPDADALWLPRVASLAGAYFGEVLRATVGGAWVEDVATPTAADQYRLKLGNRVVTPIADVHARLTGRSALALLDHATRLTR